MKKIVFNWTTFLIALLVLSFKSHALIPPDSCAPLDKHLDSSFGMCGRLSPQDDSSLSGYEIKKVVSSSNGFYVIYVNYNHKLKVVRYNNNGTYADHYNKDLVIDYVWENVAIDAVTDVNDNLVILMYDQLGRFDKINLIKIQPSGLIEFNLNKSDFSTRRSFLAIDKQSSNIFIINDYDSYSTQVYGFTPKGDSIESFGLNGSIEFESYWASSVESFYWSTQGKQLKIIRDHEIISIDINGNISKNPLYGMIASSYGRMIFNDLGLFQSIHHKTVNSYVMPIIYKNSSDGSIDKSFGENGIFKYEDYGIKISTVNHFIPIFMDQKKSIYGSFSEEGNMNSKLLRMNDKGVLDKNFAGPNKPFIVFKSEKEGFLEDMFFLNDNSPIILMVKYPSFEKAIFKLKLN